MEGKGEAGEGAWDTRLLGGQKGVWKGSRQERREVLGSSPAPPSLCTTLPSQGTGSQPGFPGMLGCAHFAGFTISLNEGSLLPLPLACEAGLGVIHFTGDHHLLPSSPSSTVSREWVVVEPGAVP